VLDQLFKEGFAELTDSRWRRSANDGAFHSGKLRFSFARFSDCSGFLGDWLNMVFPLWESLGFEGLDVLSKSEHFLSWGPSPQALG
jgi:hypothetical protein